MNNIDLKKLKIRDAELEDRDIVFKHAKTMATSFV
jgi:hypothetical protein